MWDAWRWCEARRRAQCSREPVLHGGARATAPTTTGRQCYNQCPAVLRPASVFAMKHGHQCHGCWKALRRLRCWDKLAVGVRAATGSRRCFERPDEPLLWASVLQAVGVAGLDARGQGNGGTDTDSCCSQTTQKLQQRLPRRPIMSGMLPRRLSGCCVHVHHVWKPMGQFVGTGRPIC